MEREHETGNAAQSPFRQLVDALRVCRTLSGELEVPDLRAAVEQAALGLTGALSARLVLGGDLPPVPVEAPAPVPGGSRSVPVSCGSRRLGWLEVAGLPGDLSAEALLALDFLACQAGSALASALARAEHDAERARRAQAEEELLTAIAEVRAEAGFYERVPVGVHSLDGEGRFVRINATELDWLGYARDEVVGRLRITDVCTPESRARFEARFPGFKETGSVLNHEMEFVRKDGSVFPVSVSATAVYGADGRYAFSRAVVLDLTEQRRSEATLRERERFIQRVAEATPDLAYVFDLKLGRNVYANRQLKRVLGYARDELDAMGPDAFSKLVHPDDLGVIGEMLRRLETIDDDEVVETEYRMRDARGGWRWLQSRDVVFSRDPGGSPTQVVGVTKDITVQKTAQATLARSESFYRTLAETIPGGVLIFDEDDRITWASPMALCLFGVSSGSGLEGTRLPDLVAPEFAPFVAERRRLLHLEGRPAEPAEVRFLRHDGSSFWGLVSSAPLLETDGRVSGGVTVILDTSQRRRAEEELERHERFLDSVFRATPDAMYVFDLAERRIVFANRGLASLAGYSKEEDEALKGNLLPALLHPDDLALYGQRVARYEAASDEDVLDSHFRMRHKDGSWHWLHGRGIVFERSEAGRPARILAVVKDVTTEKRAEDSLRESEAFHRTLTDTVPIGIVATDADGRITWTSPAFRALVRAPSEEDVAGSRMSDWASAGFEELVTENRRAPRSPDRQNQPREVRLRRRDGSGLWADVVSAPLFRADGAFSGAIVAVQDATDRRAANETLRSAAERLQLLSRRVVEVQEEERRHIARELHDEIGQALAAIYFRMQALLQSPGPCPRDLLEESAEIANRTIRSVRDLSLDLHPALLEEAGLAETLRWYIDRQVRGPGLDVELVACPSLMALPGDLRSACFRIVQSALTNVVRHARARAVRVEIGAREGALELVVRDDGVGFDVDATLPRASSGTSLGLLGMQERAELMGGTILFDSAPGRGTTVRARFPLPGPAGEEDAP